MALTTRLALPAPDDASVVVPAPGPGPGNWSGAPSAVLHQGVFWLAYRVRRPLAEGRGVGVVVGRSDDGVAFEPVALLRREMFGAESLERPALVPLPQGGWRLYVSCATPGSKHWWIEAVDAPTVEALSHGTRRVVLPGDDLTGVKDPVVTRDRGWQMWVCCHPLGEPGAEDRMTTAYATSRDGLDWQLRGTVLAGRAGSWDSRGARVTDVLSLDPLRVLYDGRADAASNWYETTGVAEASADGILVGSPEPLARSPHSDGALRYATSVRLPDGRTRFWFELARPDGAHDLVTSVSDPG